MFIARDIDMNQKNRKVIGSLVIFLPLVASSMNCFAQEPTLKTEPEIRALIRASRAEDHKLSDEANQVLSTLCVRDVPVLTAILGKGKTCERMEAAQLMVDLDGDNKNLMPVLIELSTRGTVFSTEKDLLCRRGATFLLAFSTEGIRVLTKFLMQWKNLFIRQSAIFAFDELTETANYPDGSLEAMKEAIPIIAESGNLDDEVMKCMSNEVLWQIVRQGSKELSEVARKYVNNSSD